MQQATTAAPSLFVEEVVPGCNYLAGRIGAEQPDGTFVPEVGAYIYIYVGGLLINPPKLNRDGTFAPPFVLSDANGFWNTSSYFLDILSPLRTGQSIVLRGKAPLKKISSRSIPYRIGGTPTPIKLGILDDFGKIRPPFEGEDVVEGYISYWFAEDPNPPDTICRGYKVAVKPGEPIFDCNTRIFIYIDDIKVGEILPNHIIGVDAEYPLFIDPNNLHFQLLVNDQPLDVPFNLFTPDTTRQLVDPVVSTSPPTYTFRIPLTTPNTGFRLFRNGLRQADGLDYTVLIDLTNHYADVTFSGDYSTDDLFTAIYEYRVDNLVIGERPSGVLDGINLIFHLTQPVRPGSLQLYRNGVRQLEFGPQPDYTVINTVITFTVAPEAGDILVTDYQSTTAPITVFVSQLAAGVIDGNNRSFLVVPQGYLGTFEIYRQGILQQRGINADYVQLGNVIQFNTWSRPLVGETIVALFSATPVTLDDLIAYLNGLDSFHQWCITASKIAGDTLSDTVYLDGKQDGSNIIFHIPPSTSPAALRLYKNGLRLKNGVDYTVSFQLGIITMATAPKPNDILTASLQYLAGGLVLDDPNVHVVTPTIVKLGSIPNSDTVQIYKNGDRLTNLGGAPDFTVVDDTVTLLVPIAPLDRFVYDYQLPGSAQLFFTQEPPEMPDGVQDIFTFVQPTQYAAIAVYVDGVRYSAGVDYMLAFSFIRFVAAKIPLTGQRVRIDFNASTFLAGYTSSQLELTSPYTLDFGPLDNAKELLFGPHYRLDPGRAEDGVFRYWFNARTSHWHYTHDVPFARGQHLTARALNLTPYSIPAA